MMGERVEAVKNVVAVGVVALLVYALIFAISLPMADALWLVIYDKGLYGKDYLFPTFIVSIGYITIALIVSWAVHRLGFGDE
ncbi:MAG: hypothetical protein ACTSPB_00265 [Candidatus Thorarchaeota archaeon]